MPESLWKIFWFNRDLLNVISGVAAGIIQEIARKKNAVTGIFTVLHKSCCEIKKIIENIYNNIRIAFKKVKEC